MKALLDEQLSPEIAERLRTLGHDVVAVIERPDLSGRSDEHILQAAADEGRAVITNNVKDFRPIAARLLALGSGHGGLILLPSARSRNRGATRAIAVGIATILEAHPDGIAGSERWLAPLA